MGNFHLPVAREGLLSQPFMGGSAGNNSVSNKAANGSTSPSLSPSSTSSPKAQAAKSGGLKTHGKLTSILNRNKQNLELNRKGSMGDKQNSLPSVVAPAAAAPKKQANQAAGPAAA